MKRNHILYFSLISITIATGLASRRYAYLLPDFINLGLGDALWALMIYWMLGFLFVKNTIRNTFLACIAICFLVECSQLIQTDWIIAIRKNKFGVLVLGQGFLWTDFVAYTLGAFFGVLVEKLFARRIFFYR